MPEERDIEKSLRDWANRRRADAGAPVELHPATRRQLQAEVSRLKTRARREPGLLVRSLLGSPLRLALNLAAAATVLVVGAFLLPRLWRAPSPSIAAPALLAQNDRKLDENARVASPAVAKDELTPTQPSAGTLQDASKKIAGETTRTTNAVSLAYNRNMVETPAPPAAMPAAPPVLVQDKLGVTNTAVFDSASATTISFENADIAQKFFRVPAPTDASRSGKLADTKLGPQAVLSSFRLEQTGGQLRVIDADGSVYTGSLTVAARTLDSNGLLRSAQNRSFRVTGTNLTRNQPVVFTGSLVLDNQSSLGTQTVSGDTAAAAPPTLLNLRVQGLALVGTNEIQINAVPARP